MQESPTKSSTQAYTKNMEDDSSTDDQVDSTSLESARLNDTFTNNFHKYNQSLNQSLNKKKTLSLDKNNLSKRPKIKYTKRDFIHPDSFSQLLKKSKPLHIREPNFTSLKNFENPDQKIPSSFKNLSTDRAEAWLTATDEYLNEVMKVMTEEECSERFSKKGADQLFHISDTFQIPRKTAYFGCSG